MAKNKNSILIVYRSPSSREVEFCDAFGEIIAQICETSHEILIVGDFNIDWTKNETYKNRIQATLNDNGLKQIVSDYTRITMNTKSLIDFVITNNENVVVKNNCANKIADHEALDIIIKNKVRKISENKEIEVFKYNKSTFSRELRRAFNYHNNQDLDNIVYNIDSCIEDTIKKLSFKKKISENNNVNTWFNRELKLLKRDKTIKYNIAKINNTYETWNNYKLSRNRYKTKVEFEKNQFICRKIRNAKDQKQMWKEIKDLVINRKRNVIQTVIFDQVEVKENVQIANKFNKYFVDSIKTIRDSIENVQYVNQINEINTRFKFRAINLQELKNICKDINSKPDFCKISIKIIIDNWNVLGNVMMDIINKSLEEGKFPENWKIT